MNKKILVMLLVGVLSLAAIFRFWKLEAYPVSLSMDEVSIGNNAYSILKTGKDEWGVPYPLAFKSVGDYKPPVNIYLTVPSLAVFGLTEWGVRFPVALLGALTSLVFALLLRQLRVSWFGAIFGGFWVAISPWHVHFSRQSFEAVTALFFLLSGVYLFLLWKQNKNGLIATLSVAFFSLSVWSYHAERLFAPLLALFLIYYSRQEVSHFVKTKWAILAVGTLLLFSIPFIKLAFFTNAIRERAISTSILRERSLILSLHDTYESKLEGVFDNNNYILLRHWVGKYLNYYDPRFWFWKGMSFTPPGHPDVGLLYVVDIPILALGIYGLATSKNKLLKLLFLFWFFIAPFPASTTMNEQHPLRALVWLPAFGILMSQGAEWIWNNKKQKGRYLFFAYGVGAIVNVIYFTNIYIKQSPYFFSEFIGWGYKEAVQYACENKDTYKQIIITDTFGSAGPVNTGIPYAYVLFYCKYDPAKFLQDNRTIEKFSFRRANWRYDPSFRQAKDTLLISAPWDLPEELVPQEKVLKVVYYPNGVPAFVFVDPSK